MWNKQSEKAARKGFTLMETLGVVGIIAVLLGIMIPSIISIQRSLQFQKMNDYAKEIFIAAQSNLSQQRAAGGLSQLCANESGTLPNGAQYVPGSGNALSSTRNTHASCRGLRSSTVRSWYSSGHT